MLITTTLPWHQAHADYAFPLKMADEDQLRDQLASIRTELIELRADIGQVQISITDGVNTTPVRGSLMQLFRDNSHKEFNMNAKRELVGRFAQILRN
jgi:hypothetical protein